MSTPTTNKSLNYLSKKSKPVLILVGNPNVGKSVFFNALTGSYVDVSNFPGTTVDISTGSFEQFTVIDTPGVYGISSFNDEEIVTRNAVIHSDLILNVIDAVHLERDLFLTQQLIDMGKPLVIALNMIDEVEKAEVSLDVDALSKALGIQVIPCSATKGKGIDEVKKALISGGRIGTPSPGIDIMLEGALKHVETRLDAVLLLEEDVRIAVDVAIKNQLANRESLYKIRRQHIDGIYADVYRTRRIRITFLERFGDYMLNPVTGFPLLIIMMASIFAFIGIVVAQGVVGITEGLIMKTYYNNFIQTAASGFLDSRTFMGGLLIGDYGLLTMVPIYLFGLLLPLVFSFYILMSALEDSGLMPRIAVLLDRLFTYFGLNGRAVIPMILGFGCVTMALISTRILGSKRERIIATILLCIAVPCSAQFGVIIAIAATLNPAYSLIYTLTILSIFFVLGIFLNLLLPGKSTELLIDIPPVRIPVLSNILRKTGLKVKHFLLEAGPMFALGSVIVSVLNYTGSFSSISRFFAPVTENLLQLPAGVTNVMIMGIIRRDFGAAGLSAMVDTGQLSSAQTVVALVVITLFVPCIASIMVLFKERKPLDAIMIWGGSFVVAFLVGAGISQILI